MRLLSLSQQQVRELLDPEQLLQALAEGFVALSGGRVDAPPRQQASTARGTLLAMPAALPATPVAAKLVTVFHGNPARGMPGHHALVLLFDADSGVPLALINGNHLTAMRTAAAALLSIRLLARAQARSVVIVGAGVAGAAHLALLGLQTGIDTIRIAARNPERAVALAAADPRAVATADVEAAVRAADIVCLCTGSPEPVIRRDWLRAGTHVSSVGYRPPGGELGADVIGACELYVESRCAFEAPPAGCAELAGVDPASATELGEVLSGARPGRRSAQAVTVYKSMGHAMEDAVAANLVYREALRRGVGETIAL